MTDKIETIVKQGQELAEKRTWLTKGYADIIVKINAELAKIPDMPEDDINFDLKTWTHDDSYTSHKRRLIIAFVFSDDAYIVMQLGKEDAYNGKWDWDDIKNPSVARIRLFATKLKEAFTFFADKINERNLENQMAINTITDLLNKLA